MSINEEKKRLLDELENLGPSLHRLKVNGTDGGGPAVPPGYFDAFTDRMLERLREEEGMPTAKRPPVLLRAIRSFRFPMAVAAAMALLVTAVWFMRRPAGETPLAAEAINLRAEEAESYILDHLEDYEPELLAQHLLNDPPEKKAPSNAAPQTKPTPNTTAPSAAPRQQPAKKAGDFNFDDLSDEDLDALMRELTEDDILNML